MSVRETFPPEEIEAAIRRVLQTAVDAAVENWSEGFWLEIDDDTTTRDVLDNFVFFIREWLGVEDEEFARPVLVENEPPRLAEATTVIVDGKSYRVLRQLGGWDVIDEASGELLSRFDPLDAAPTEQDIRVLAAAPRPPESEADA